MSEFALIIEYLLLNSEGVVVPGLGAFRTVSFASQWLEEEGIFLPPVRHIRFNADIFQDSSDTFVKALAGIYGIGLEEAVEMCEKMVGEFHKNLVVEGTVDFGSLGLFTLQDDAEITMSPYECGITSPGFYGLDVLPFPLLSGRPQEDFDEVTEVAATQPETIVQTTETEKPALAAVHAVVAPKSRVYVADSKHIVIRLNRAFVHYTMVAAASVVLFFLLNPRIMDEQRAETVNQSVVNYVISSPNVPETSSSNTSLISLQITEEQKVEVKEQAEGESADVQLESDETIEQMETEEVVEKVEAEEEVTVVETIPRADDNQSQTALRGAYSIVLASAISQANATAFVNRLQEMEIDAVVYDNGKMLRVVIDGFDSQAEAYNQNNRLHKMDKEFRSTWVMKN